MPVLHKPISATHTECTTQPFCTSSGTSLKRSSEKDGAETDPALMSMN